MRSGGAEAQGFKGCYVHVALHGSPRTNQQIGGCEHSHTVTIMNISISQTPPLYTNLPASAGDTLRTCQRFYRFWKELEYTLHICWKFTFVKPAKVTEHIELWRHNGDRINERYAHGPHRWEVWIVNVCRLLWWEVFWTGIECGMQINLNIVGARYSSG